MSTEYVFLLVRRRVPTVFKAENYKILLDTELELMEQA